jgi:membrane protein
VKARAALRAVRERVAEFMKESPFEKAAAVSYYALLALAPLLLVVLAIAGLAFGADAVRAGVVAELRGLIGEKGGEAIELVLENATMPSEGALALVLGMATLLLGASGVFIQLQSALNGIWDVEPMRKGNALWIFLRHRLASIAMVVGLGFLMLVSLVVSAALNAVNQRYGAHVPWPLAWEVLNALGSLCVITLMIAMIYRFLPDVRIPWRDVWLGALVTAVLFTVGKSAIGVYLGRASFGSSYGAAGSVVVLVVWVYYASLIFFVGAEITHVHSGWRRRRAERAALQERRARARLTDPGPAPRVGLDSQRRST